MTNPPPPGNWGPPHPPYGQGQPQYGPGQWPPQQPGWGPPPTPRNNGLKWLLISVAVLLVIAISVGATLLFTRDSGNGPTQSANGSPPAAGDIASANDTGPIRILTEDPTCEAWRPINDTLVDAQRRGWAERDYTVPASAWNSEQRSMHDEMAAAMRRAADQTVTLAKITPHRIMRELYEQSIAYWRAYADSIPDYELKDNSLAVTASDTSGAIVTICAAIDYRSAAMRGPLVPAGDQRLDPASPGDPANPQMFLQASGNAVCNEWTKISDRFDDDTKQWRESDGSIPASEWTPERRSLMDSAAQEMLRYADDIQRLGEQSGNAILYDFASLAAQYFRAYTHAIPSYTSADSYLSATASYANFIVFNACAAVEKT